MTTIERYLNSIGKICFIDYYEDFRSSINKKSLPDDLDEYGRFAKLFSSLNDYLEAARIHGFTWKQQIYPFKKPKKVMEMIFDENTYLVLALRYKELFTEAGDGGSGDIPFDIDGHLVAIDTGRIYVKSSYLISIKILWTEAPRSGWIVSRID